ncbi:Amyloid protein-binding protein 2 [Chamberlinius hualienensis]
MANMAIALNWIPESLYNMAIKTFVSNYHGHQKDLPTLPNNVKFDIYYEFYKNSRLCELAVEFRKLSVFTQMLKVNDKRHHLHHCFQALMDHGSRLSESLSRLYAQHCQSLLATTKPYLEAAIQMGFSIGSFLNDAGWFEDGEKVMVACLQLCKLIEDKNRYIKVLDCYIRLLHARNVYCKFSEAESTFLESKCSVEQMVTDGCLPNLAGLYAEYSLHFFIKSHYDEAYHWSILALNELHSNLPPKTVVDVLRQAAKACVVKREFKRSELLITHAVRMAREYFGSRHPKYSDALLDYGFHLLNVDCVSQSVQVYQMALNIRQAVFGGKNIHVAIAHEDLAYASYVNEYSTGRFQNAFFHVERALEIMNHLLPADHLLLSSSKRVKALILEEIAIDSQDKAQEKLQLLEAQDLHLSALSLAKKAYGEMNVQTAKHYGNLGRLYQSMKRYEEAEMMHMKAIAIKERLLGADDYEVALSVGHLASLYNYDMNKYDEARQLYLRSIAIGIKIFGKGYSGLEYDYRGLIRVYNMLHDYTHINKYNSRFHRWKQLRDGKVAKDNLLLLTNNSTTELLSNIEELVQTFFQIEPTINLENISKCFPPTTLPS